MDRDHRGDDSSHHADNIAPRSEAARKGGTTVAPRRAALLAAVAAVVLFADVATKEMALAWFSPRDPVELLGGFLTLTLVFNPGAAFSIGTELTWIFSVIAIGVVGYIAVLARKVRHWGWGLSLGLILGGAAGNLVDRIIREPAPLRGEVIDWIQVPNWPVFNLADSAIVCGGALAVLLAFQGRNLDGTRDVGETESPASDTDTVAFRERGERPGEGHAGHGGERSSDAEAAKEEGRE